MWALGDARVSTHGWVSLRELSAISPTDVHSRTVTHNPAFQRIMDRGHAGYRWWPLARKRGYAKQLNFGALYGMGSRRWRMHVDSMRLISALNSLENELRKLVTIEQFDLKRRTYGVFIQPGNPDYRAPTGSIALPFTDRPDASVSAYCESDVRRTREHPRNVDAESGGSGEIRFGDGSEQLPDTGPYAPRVSHVPETGHPPSTTDETVDAHGYQHVVRYTPDNDQFCVRCGQARLMHNIEGFCGASALDDADRIRMSQEK